MPCAPAGAYTAGMLQALAALAAVAGVYAIGRKLGEAPEPAGVPLWGGDQAVPPTNKAPLGVRTTYSTPREDWYERTGVGVLVLRGPPIETQFYAYMDQFTVTPGASGSAWTDYTLRAGAGGAMTFRAFLDSVTSPPGRVALIETQAIDRAQQGDLVASGWSPTVRVMKATDLAAYLDQIVYGDLRAKDLLVVIAPPSKAAAQRLDAGADGRTVRGADGYWHLTPAATLGLYAALTGARGDRRRDADYPGSEAWSFDVSPAGGLAWSQFVEQNHASDTFVAMVDALAWTGTARPENLGTVVAWRVPRPNLDAFMAQYDNRDSIVLIDP